MANKKHITVWKRSFSKPFHVNQFFHQILWLNNYHCSAKIMDHSYQIYLWLCSCKVAQSRCKLILISHNFLIYLLVVGKKASILLTLLPVTVFEDMKRCQLILYSHLSKWYSNYSSGKLQCWLSVTETLTTTNHVSSNLTRDILVILNEQSAITGSVARLDSADTAVLWIHTGGRESMTVTDEYYLRDIQLSPSSGQ